MTSQRNANVSILQWRLASQVSNLWPSHDDGWNNATFHGLDRPIFLFHCRDKKVIYWKNTNDYYRKVKDITRLHPPLESVAMEFFNEGTIYRKEESAQEIEKSTWFETGKYDSDDEYFEYAIVTKDYNTVLSVVWED